MLIHRQRGFSLAEMAIVLVIVGILMASGLGALSSQLSNQRIKETKQMLERANEALLGYALSHNRLPCPADAAGLESTRTAGQCTALYGDLPWQALGLPENDSWGRRLKYRVTSTFAKQDAICGDTTLSPCFTLQSVGDNTVKSAAGSYLISTSAAAAAIIFSEGPNGDNSTSSANETENRDCKSPHNATCNKIFVQDSPDANFDDILIWIPTLTLLYRLSVAGKWS